jgi:iron complex outermembrane receptor protein
LKNKLYIALLFILFSVSAVAQKGNISGNVTDTLNAVIPATEIVLKDTRYGTVSNAKGEYNLKNINYGTYTLIAFALGKEIYATKVEVNKPLVTVNIVLKPLKGRIE